MHALQCIKQFNALNNALEQWSIVPVLLKIVCLLVYLGTQSG